MQYSSQFYIKYVLRVLKLITMIILVHKTITDYLNGQLDPSHPIFYTTVGLILMITSYVNTKILSPEKMGQKRKLWIGYHHLKLLITILLYVPIGKLLFGERLVVDLRMYWVGSIMVVAPFMRYYREHHASKNIKI